MRTQTFAVAALLAAAAFTVPVVAFAQGTPTPQQKEQARQAMDEGDKKRDSGDLSSALAAYERADGIMNVPTTAIEVGRTQVALGKLLQAEATLNRLLKLDRKPGEPAPFGAARKTAETMLADLATRVPSITVVLANADPAQPPTVTIDGEALADAAAPRKVNPGAHKIVAKSGSVEKTADVTVAEKETKTVHLDLKDPKAVVVAPTPEKPKGVSSAKLMMYGGFGLAAVGIGVGAATGLMSISKTNDLKDHCPQDRCAVGSQDDIDSATLLGNISTIAFIAGGVGAGVGVVGLILSRKESKEAAPPPTAFQPTNIRAVLGPSYAGIAGRF